MKTIIKNRRDQNMVVYVDIPEGNIKGLVFVQHGLGGFADQIHIKAIRGCFFNKGYITVIFDATNSLGESDGELVDCTMNTHYHDLEDVIKWASTQEWYQERFVLVGHSMGGMSTLIYTEKNPEKIKGLAPIATTVSYEFSERNNIQSHPERWDKLKRNGVFTRMSVSKPGFERTVSWQLYESLKNYNVLDQINEINMPTLMIVGKKDTSTPLDQQEFLFSKLDCEKEIHIIEDCPHDFREPEHLEQLKNIFNQWIEKL